MTSRLILSIVAIALAACTLLMMAPPADPTREAKSESALEASAATAGKTAAEEPAPAVSPIRTESYDDAAEPAKPAPAETSDATRQWLQSEAMSLHQQIVEAMQQGGDDSQARVDELVRRFKTRAESRGR